MRVIDADALKHAVSNIDMHGRSEQFYEIMGEIAEVLSSAPTIDAVPVVRCSACEFGDPVWTDQGYWEPPTCDGIRCTRFADTAMDYDDYCSYGKQKEGPT